MLSSRFVLLYIYKLQPYPPQLAPFPTQPPLHHSTTHRTHLLSSGYYKSLSLIVMLSPSESPTHVHLYPQTLTRLFKELLPGPECPTKMHDQSGSTASAVDQCCCTNTQLLYASQSHHTHASPFQSSSKHVVSIPHIYTLCPPNAKIHTHSPNPAPTYTFQDPLPNKSDSIIHSIPGPSSHFIDSRRSLRVPVF